MGYKNGDIVVVKEKIDEIEVGQICFVASLKDYDNSEHEYQDGEPVRLVTFNKVFAYVDQKNIVPLKIEGVQLRNKNASLFQVHIPETKYYIKFGNHWLKFDEAHFDANTPDWTFHSWVSDLSSATLHSLEFVDSLKKSEAYRSINYYTVDVAFNLKKKSLENDLKVIWLYQFEKAVHEKYGTRIAKDGIWTNAHMYYGQNLTVDQAIIEIGESYGIES